MDHSSECGLSKDFGQFYLSETYSDVTIIVENERIPAHKTILAMRSEYFAKLLFGGMMETHQKEITISEIPIEGFKMILKFVYTDRMNLHSTDINHIIEALGVAHQYQLVDLEKRLSAYLCKMLTIQNASLILNAVSLYNLSDAIHDCCIFMCKNSTIVINDEVYLQLTRAALCNLLSYDSFYFPEILIFHAVCKWCEVNQEIFNKNETQLDVILKCVRLSTISTKNLINIVRGIPFITDKAIVDAIDQSINTSPNNLLHRGELLKEMNLAKQTSKISENVWICELQNLYLVNCIIIILQSNYYGYTINLRIAKIETSIDKKDWTNATFFWEKNQPIYIEERVIKFIRIEIEKNNYAQHFQGTEVKYVSNPKIINGFIQPTQNVAVSAEGAALVEGTNLNGESLRRYKIVANW